jgi:hypothetical protein
MQELVRSRPEAAHPYAAVICAGTLSVFQSLASDAQLLEALSALLACLAGAPGCLPLMAQTGLPTLVATLQNGTRKDLPAGHSILLEGTLDLLCSFVSEIDPGRSLPMDTCIASSLAVLFPAVQPCAGGDFLSQLDQVMNKTSNFYMLAQHISCSPDELS